MVLTPRSAVTQNTSLGMVPIRKLQSQKCLRVRRIHKNKKLNCKAIILQLKIIHFKIIIILKEFKDLEGVDLS